MFHMFFYQCLVALRAKTHARVQMVYSSRETNVQMITMLYQQNPSYHTHVSMYLA